MADDYARRKQATPAASTARGIDLPTDNAAFAPLLQNGTEERIVRTVREQAPISRARIAATAGLPNAAVSRGAARLLERGLLDESGLTDRTGPRAKRGLQLSPRAGHVIAVEYRGGGIEGVAVNSAYECIGRATDATPLAGQSQDARLAAIVAFVRDLAASVPTDRGPCLGIGLVDPGVVDTEAGRTVKCTTLDKWHDVPVVAHVNGELGLPALLLNSMIAGIRAVDRIELGGSYSDLMFIEYGDGIACGLKIGGRYVGGHSGLAGELGHLRVTDRPIACRCGAVGCLEAIAALPAMARDLRAATGNECRGIEVLHAAAAGDGAALRVVTEAFGCVGRTIAGMINVLDPEAVVLDLLFAAAGDNALAALTAACREAAAILHARTPELRLSSLDEHLCSLGAAAAVLDHCWTDGR